MKRHLVNLSKVVAGFALFVTALNVNYVCMFVAHQPKLPEGAKKLRKF